MAAVGPDRRGRYADLDGGARLPEVGEPPARRRARHHDCRSARARDAARAAAADARPPDRGAAPPPARAADRGQPRRARRPHLLGLRREDADRLVPRLSQGALLVVGAVQGVAALGELLHRRHRLPRVPVGPDLCRLARLRAREPLRRRRCCSASPSRARRSTSSTRPTCDARSAVRALAGGVGVVAGLVVCAIVAAAAARRARPAGRQPRRRSAATDYGRRGAASDGARRRARGSAIPSCRQVSCATARSSSRVASRSTSPAISPSASASPASGSSTSSRPRGCSSPRCVPGISRSPRSGRSAAASAAADLSDPYLGTDQAVVLRRGLPRLTTLADLRRKITCAVRGSDGARAIAGSVRPAREADSRLARPSGCSSSSRRARATRPSSTRTPSGSSSPAVAASSGPSRPASSAAAATSSRVTRGGPIAVSEVDRALARMRADGTMHRLARQWLGIDPARLRPLR